MPDAIPPQGCALAFDFGEVRIGVAQGNTEINIAHPLTTITGNNNQVKFSAIGELISQWQPRFLVVGIPTHADGNEHQLTHLAKKFGYRLHGRFKLPIYWVDERFSSIYAEELLRQAHVFGKKQRTVLDQIAAQAILQTCFDGSWLGVFNGQIQTTQPENDY